MPLLKASKIAFIKRLLFLLNKKEPHICRALFLLLLKGNSDVY